MSYLVAELLRKKRDGFKLATGELEFLVKGFADGSIPDYQASAWLMAVVLRGMTHAETQTLTRAIKDSGRSLEWRKLSETFAAKDFTAKFADKHSTGGVGDKVSLILAPVAAALGLKVPMMSGRGLGHTGGTVDKLQAIPGFNMYPDLPLMLRLLNEVGVCMICQTEDLCPADRKLYSLRDVTATVESIPLITASIVSKKWAEGVDAIVYDVKAGDGAFMPTVDEARSLARSLVNTSQRAGMRSAAWITRMEEPLGAFIGNALEVRESLAILRGKYSGARAEQLAQPLAELSCVLAAEMAVRAGLFKDDDAGQTEALNRAREVLRDGSALRIFSQMCLAQGAAPDWESRLATAPLQVTLASPRAGTVSAIRSRTIGVAGLTMDVGRQKVSDVIDPATGFEMCVRPGQRVAQGDALVVVHAQNAGQVEALRAPVLSAFVIDDSAPYELAPYAIERILPDIETNTHSGAQS